MERWWSDHELVNGVFKGGGAKGVAYAGALMAMESRSVWFGSVAGTSAGAITASLIAAGFQPTEMATHIDDLLASIKRRIGRLVVGGGDAAFDGQGLRDRLDRLFRQAVGRDPHSAPVTFQELYDATEISLYVVALDLARSQPTVFSVYTTPDVSVSAAVLASSAIPGAFPSVRGVFTAERKAWAQRLVDGGAWANFPRFVYHDPSFARWIEMHCGTELEQQRTRPTIGFAIGVDSDETPVRPDRLTLSRIGAPEYDHGILQDSSNPMMWALGGLLSGRFTRLLLLLGWLSIAAILWIFFRSNIQSAIEYTYLRALGPLGASLGLIYALVVMVGLGVGTVLPLVVIAFSRPLGDVVLPSAKAALAVGTGVAPWVGAAAADHFVRIDPCKLTTLGFRPTDEAKAEAIKNARTVTLDYLDTVGWGRVTATTGTVEQPDPGPTSAVGATKRTWIDRLIGSRGIVGPLPVVLILLAALSVVLATLFPYLIVYSHFDLNQTVLQKIRDVVLVAGILVAASVLAYLFCKFAAAWHNMVPESDLPSTTVRRISYTLVVTFVVISGALTWSAVSTARNDLALYHRATAEVTVTGIEGSASVLRPGWHENLAPAVGRDYRYTFETTDDRIPAHKREFWSRELHGINDKVRLGISLIDMNWPLTEDSGEPNPFSAILFALALVSAIIAYWIFRVVARGPGLASIRD